MSSLLVSDHSLAAASLVVALTSADDKKAQVSAALARTGLAAVSEKYQKQVEALWEAANKEALEHLLLVLTNNPHKSKADILKRPDIQSALTTPYTKAAQASEKILKQAWEASQVETVKKLKGEFKLLGEDWKGYDVDPALLESLVDDLHANAKAMRSRFGKALTDPNFAQERLLSLARDVRLRASYSVSTGVWGVSSQVRESAIDKAGLNKMWVAIIDNRTCSHCKALNGTVLSPYVQFPVNAGRTHLKVYMGQLFGPPRHPNCRCILVPVKLKKSKTKT